MSNGFSTYASYTELSSINEVEQNQIVQNLTVTGKLTLSHPLEINDGGTSGVTEDGVRTNLNVYSKDEIHSLPCFNYTEEEVAVGTYFGKTLYRQFFSGTVATAGTTISLGTISDFGALIKVEGAVVNNTSGIWFSFPLSHAATAYTSTHVNADGTVQLVASAAGCTYNIFYYYTKAKSGGGGGGGGGGAA